MECFLLINNARKRIVFLKRIYIGSYYLMFFDHVIGPPIVSNLTLYGLRDAHACFSFISWIPCILQTCAHIRLFDRIYNHNR